MGEFDVIRTYFTRPVRQAALGVGDDCALLNPRAGMQMAISSDMLVSGRHFFADVDPRTLGHKALAVNLSDLAACGARPVAFTLALAFPEVHAPWLAEFSHGLWALADTHGCELIGGDTTRGPLNICITVFGEVPAGQALLRSGAQVGDDVWVSGTLGDAALALRALQGQVQLAPEALTLARARLETPTPRVALGMALRGIASAAADVSDGLVGDLGHILQQSGVGASLDLPSAMQLIATQPDSISANGHAGTRAADATAHLLRQCVLAGGDDYELVFTAAPAHRAQVQAVALQAQVPVRRIGTTESAPGLRWRDAQGQSVPLALQAFDHFVGAPAAGATAR